MPNLLRTLNTIISLSERLQKAKHYLEPGTKPPTGTNVQRGPRGGRYFLSGKTSGKYAAQNANDVGGGPLGERRDAQSIHDEATAASRSEVPTAAKHHRPHFVEGFKQGFAEDYQPEEPEARPRFKTERGRLKARDGVTQKIGTDTYKKHYFDAKARGFPEKEMHRVAQAKSQEASDKAGDDFDGKYPRMDWPARDPHFPKRSEERV